MRCISRAQVNFALTIAARTTWSVDVSLISPSAVCEVDGGRVKELRRNSLQAKLPAEECNQITKSVAIKSHWRLPAYEKRRVTFKLSPAECRCIATARRAGRGWDHEDDHWDWAGGLSDSKALYEASHM